MSHWKQGAGLAALAPTIKPVTEAAGGSVEAALDRLAGAGFSAVQLDATLRGCRPRELDGRARKGLAAAVRRRGLAIGGLDLFIPTAHFVEPANVDRAAAAAVGAIDLAGDLGRIVLSVALPVGEVGQDVLGALVQRAESRGVVLAVRVDREDGPAAAWLEEVDLARVGASVDPAVCLGAGSDPVAVAHAVSRRLVSARLSDVGGGSGPGGGAGRCAVGEGQLDVLGYRVALSMAGRLAGPIVLDLVGLERPLAQAAAGQRAWARASPPVG